MATVDKTSDSDPNCCLEERFRAFVTATSDVVFQMSADWRVMHKLVGKSCFLETRTGNRSWLKEYIPLSDQAQVQEAIDEAIQTKKNVELEHRVNRTDGTIGWTFSRAIPLLDEHGEVTEWFGTTNDITERKEAQERNRTLFDSIDQGVYCCRLIAEPGQPVDMLCLHENQTAIRLNGQSYVGRRLRAINSVYEEQWYQICWDVAQTGYSQRVQQYAQADGRWYDFHIARAGGPDDQLVVILFQDITTCLQAEESLRQNHQQQAFLLRLADALRPLADPLAIEQESLRVLRGQLGTSRAIYAEALDQAGMLRIKAESLEPGLSTVPMKGTVMHLGDFTDEVFTETSLGRPLWQQDVLADDHSPEQQANYTALGTRAWVMTPLVKEGRLVAVLAVHHSEPRAWTTQEIGFVQETAERTWIAVKRAHTEAALRQRERELVELRHLTLLSQTEALARMGSWEYHRHSGHFNWSAGMYQLAQLDPEQPLSPEVYLDLVVEEDRDRAQALTNHLREGHGHFEGQFCIRAGDDIKTLRIKADVIGEGEQIHVVGVDMDITQQLLAEQRIQETADSLQAVLDASPASIGLLKAQRDDTGRIADFYLAVGNDKLARFFGQPLSELVGQSAERFSELLWHGETLNRLKDLFATREGFYEEKTLPPPNQETWIAISVTQQDDGIVLTGLNITALKRAQAQQQHWLEELETSRHSVEALAQLKAALQHRSESLRAVSHDLKSNFGIINGSLSLLELAESEAERGQFVEMALRNVHQATGLLGELLDLTRLESSEQMLRLSNHNVADLFTELGKSLEPLADQQELHLQLTGPNMLEVETDQLLLYRLVQNLVMNALKYTHQGQVELSWGLETETNQWWFRVTDTGPGLATELVERFTTPVSKQASPEANSLSARSISSGGSTAKESWASLRGEGIGLRIVREISSLLSAELQVSSEEEKGTQFEIRLPLSYSFK